MSYIRTHTKREFYPLAPDAAQIDIRDIAHALSMLCRANGHFPHFYSVGQHCIACAEEAAARGYSRRVQLGCLLHDASEAYLADVTRPVKKQLPKYLEIEEPLQDAIWSKWLQPALTPEEEELVFLVDDAMLYYEFLSLMGEAIPGLPLDLMTAPELSCMPFTAVEEKYIALFEKLK